MMDLKPDPGTYALVLKNKKLNSVQIGKRRQIKIEPGYYIYVGSALGNGGIKARVMRHCIVNKSKHWHIDYMKDYMHLHIVLYSYYEKRLEHKWANSLQNFDSFSTIPKIGCSDCNCVSHLFYSINTPNEQLFLNLPGNKIGYYTPKFCGI